MLGSAEILRSLELTAEENRLSDPGRETPDDGIERADRIKLRCSESACGAEHKAWQACRASLIHAMKGGGEAALARDEVRPAFENLRGQTGGHGFRLIGEGTSHVKFAGRISAGDNFDRADCLCPRLLRSVERLLRTGGARGDLRHVEIAREPLRFLHIGQF